MDEYDSRLQGEKLTRGENEYLQEMSKEYNNFLRESGYCITHNDLYGENLLVNNNNELTGIIDFGNMAYCPKEPDFAPLYKLDREIFTSTIIHYSGSVDIERVKMCLYFESVTFFKYVQDWSEDAILKEVQEIKNTEILDGMKRG